MEAGLGNGNEQRFISSHAPTLKNLDRRDKLAKDSQRVKTATLGRFYAGLGNPVDLLAGECCESEEFRFTSNLGLFVLNPVD